MNLFGPNSQTPSPASSVLPAESPSPKADPPYYAAHKGKATPFAIERGILRNWQRAWSINPASCPFNHEEEIEFKKPIPPMRVQGWTQHFLRYLRMLIPNLQLNPWLVRMIWSVEKTYYIEGRKICNLIGSKNSGKTEFFADIAHGLVSIWPEFSRCYISGPYKTAADATIWGRASSRFANIKASPHHNMAATMNYIPTKGRFIYWGGSEEAGYIELVTLDKVGKLQGAKSIAWNKGFLVLICDEISTFPSRALLDALDNLTGNQNFLCLTGCNFKDTEGLEGDLCRPSGREYAEINIETEFDWPSNYKSWTFRFDGHQSPNVLYPQFHEEPAYPYLLRENTRQDMEETHGQKGPKYLEQIRSAPNSSMSDFYVTSREKVLASGGNEKVIFDEWEKRRVIFCDPGFGGDPCKVGCFEFGAARVETMDGQYAPLSIFQAVEPIQTIRLEKGRKADAQWINRIRAVSNGSIFLTPGDDITMENQIVVQVAEYARKHGVPFNMLGFDGSMRSGIVHEFVALLGGATVPMDFGGMATERNAYLGVDKMAKDVYVNFVTELYFNVGSMIQARQFRNADAIPAALAQIYRRPWKNVGAKKQIQPKEEFKKNNQGRSPDDSDVLVGAFEMALRNGFVTVTRRRPEAAEAVLNPTSFAEMFRGGRITSLYRGKPLNNP